MNKVQVRKALAEDATAIPSIYNQHIDIGGSTFDRTYWTVNGVCQLIVKPAPDAWFIAEHAGQLVGWSAARPHSARFGYRYTCETAIYLAPESTGCGIGSLLQSRIEQHCIESGLHHAVAKIISDNERSISFHQRHGYEIVGVQREIGNMNGKWCDVTIMQKIFHGSPP